MGGLLVIGTLDHKCLPPVKGKPFMMSPYILTSFDFVTHQHSVRANRDLGYQRLQNIAHLHARKYKESPKLIVEFKILIISVCTFADDWSSPKIAPDTYCLYDKMIPEKISKR